MPRDRAPASLRGTAPRKSAILDDTNQDDQKRSLLSGVVALCRSDLVVCGPGAQLGQQRMSCGLNGRVAADRGNRRKHA